MEQFQAYRGLRVMILITGASGHIGSRAAALLAGDGHRLRLMTRSPHEAPRVPNAQIVQGDFAKPKSLEEAFRGITAALIISGSEKPGKRAELHRNAFQAAAAAKVEHIVYLSLQNASPIRNIRSHGITIRVSTFWRRPKRLSPCCATAFIWICSSISSTKTG